MSDTLKKQSAVGSRILYVVLAIGCVLGAIALLEYWVCSIVLGLAALACFGALFVNSYEAACPHCSTKLEVFGDDRKKPYLCKECKRYLRVESDTVEPWPEDGVTLKPEFHVQLTQGQRLPAVCASCGGPATRAVELDWKQSQTGSNIVASVAGSILTGGIMVVHGGESTGTIPVPHCDEHQEGAAAKRDGEGFRLSVCSHRFVMDFCAENGSAPVP